MKRSLGAGEWIRRGLGAAVLVGVAAIALYGISTAIDLTFSKNSSLATSGGFGPNQVSAALGLGALLALLVILVRKVDLRTRFLVLVAMLYLAVQSALTFSRGGLYNAVGAALFASVYFMRDAQTRARMLMVVPILLLLVNYAVLPQLDNLTEGALSERFKSVDTTNRAEILLAQLDVWREHPFFGVGPGQARSFAGAVAHTEMSRLVAEHGLFGLVALILLLLGGARNLRRARTGSARAVVAASIGWSLLFMLNAGMRLSAPSLLFGLSFLTLLNEEDLVSRKGRPPRRPPQEWRGRATDRRSLSDSRSTAIDTASRPSTDERTLGNQDSTAPSV
jgi:O-antigen ligase